MDHDIKIIRYLDGEMKGEELTDFEREVRNDARLAELVEEIRRLQELAARAIVSGGDPESNLDGLIRADIHEMVREYREGKSGAVEFGRIAKEAEEAYFKGKSGNRTLSVRRMQAAWYSIAAILIIGGILTIALLRPFSRQTPSMIYAEYAGTYTLSEEMAELTRSDDDLLFAIEVFEARDYERSTVLFSMLADSSVRRELALLYLGHSYMGLNRTDMAVETYKEVLMTANGALLEDARWYLAICHLKRGDADDAASLLEALISSDTPYSSSAKRILRDLR